MKFVSVIVPVYNDRERLTRCLQALQRQTYPREAYEVVVVDNGSDESPAAVTDRFERVRLVVEERRGSYAARNRGIRAAQGELFAFTDADCLPAEDWLEKGGACFERNRRCGLVAGKVDMTVCNSAQPTACEWYDRLFYMNQQSAVEEGNYGCTANLFTSRRVVEAVGSFDATLKSSGDNEWGRRVHRHGYRPVYCAEAVVQHPARTSLRTLLRKERRIAGGLVRLGEKQKTSSVPGRSATLGERMRIWMQPWRNALGVVVGSTSRRIPSVLQRLRLAGIILLVYATREFEAWRVRRGGTPKNT